MYKLKLIKVKSYSGAVRANKKNPYVEVKTDDEAQALIKTGYFELCETVFEADTVDTVDTEDSAPDYEALSEMSKAELVQYAADNGISVEGCKTKSDILEAISIANGGSATMIDLEQ